MPHQPVLTEEQRAAFREHFRDQPLYHGNRFGRGPVFDVVLAISGEYQCAFASIPLGSVDDASPSASDVLGRFLADIDVPYYSYEEKQSAPVGDHEEWVRHYYVSTDDAIIEEIQHAISDDDAELTAERRGELLGYPQEAIDAYNSGERPQVKRAFYSVWAALTLEEASLSDALIAGANRYDPPTSIEGYQQALREAAERRAYAKQLDEELGFHYFENHVTSYEGAADIDQWYFVCFLFLAHLRKRLPGV